MKKILCLLAFFSLISCSNNDYYPYCPNVVIPRASAYVTQKVNSRDEFQIQLTGFEGYCYFDKKVNRQKAVITPLFEIIKLRMVDESELSFNFFTQTIKGPPAYLGKWVHPVTATIPLNEKFVKFKGNPVELKIPNENPYGFEIMLGLQLSNEEKLYNSRTFDINYKFEEND